MTHQATRHRGGEHVRGSIRLIGHFLYVQVPSHGLGVNLTQPDVARKSRMEVSGGTSKSKEKSETSKVGRKDSFLAMNLVDECNWPLSVLVVVAMTKD